MSTYTAKPGEVKANWHVVDATDHTLGRLAARLAHVIQGKHKPTYTAHVDCGDFVVVTNVDKLKVTGKKAEVYEYDTYSRYPGGRHIWSYERMRAESPERILEIAVKRMLPKSKMGRRMLLKLKAYKTGEYTGQHAAQQPKELSFAK